jgi:competence protein ComGC
MAKLSVLREMWEFIRLRKKYWLIPVIVVLLLVGVLLFLTEGSAIAPFIYTLF